MTLTLAEALARVAGSPWEPPPFGNRVPRFRAWCDTETARYVLAVDLIDDGTSRYGAPPSTPPQWWGAARLIDRVEDIPATAGELVAAVLRKTLELPCVAPTQRDP